MNKRKHIELTIALEVEYFLFKYIRIGSIHFDDLFQKYFKEETLNFPEIPFSFLSSNERKTTNERSL